MNETVRGGLLAGLAVTGMCLGSVGAALAATTIMSGPQGDSLATDATFTFTDDAAASFLCTLDGAAPTACTSPYDTGSLALGSHRFTVQAVDQSGVPLAQPVDRSWSVVAPLATPRVVLRTPVDRSLRRRDFDVVSGAASAPSGVVRVEISLTRGAPDHSYFPPGCTYVGLRNGRTDFEPCLLPPYVRARGTTNWRYTIPRAVRRRLSPGHYRLIVRAINGYQQASREEFPLTLR